MRVQIPPLALRSRSDGRVRTEALPETRPSHGFGTPIDLAKADQDACLLAALTDHITPLEACYRTRGLLGGGSRFVLSSSGHIQARRTGRHPRSATATTRCSDPPLAGTPPLEH
ncbi:MAG TPA: hypothetical protein VEG38_14510 [Acidimicrobiia bacterium]|nr:hypothetical protein [Acidimicrobiia bacterium]